MLGVYGFNSRIPTLDCAAFVLVSIRFRVRGVGVWDFGPWKLI